MVDFCCKYCGSTNIVRYGRANAVQYWWCKDCKRKFADNDALPEMKTPMMQVAAALSMYYRGMSIDEIRGHLDQQYNNCPSSSTIYDWICRFTEEADRKTRDYKPNVGYVWVADETMLDIGGKKIWFWDLIDIKTRFLLASHMSFNRTTQHAKSLVEKAANRAGKSPKVIITDKLGAYLDGIELALGADTRHVQSRGFTLKPNTNLIERFHGTLKDRTKIMRGLKDIKSARLITEGWLLHYNFLRPHEALKGKTPAEVAGVKYPYHNWQEIVAKREVITPAKVSTTSTIIIPELVSRPKPLVVRKRLRKLRRHREKPVPALVTVRV